MIKNSRGNIFYGMHFYPGVAEYRDKGKDPYRVFLNEDTIRAMDASFAGRPVFVMHVDGVEDDINELRKDADGWVIESFFNKADGKHWVKFIVVSEKAEQAIRRGFKLSNCYKPTGMGDGGQWNGVSYAKEIKGGEYDHLAIVPDPRYEESVIMTPDQFKNYNAEKEIELEKIANNKEEPKGMKLFNRTKVEKTVDIENMSIVLEKSGKEMTIKELANSMDEYEIRKKEKQFANGDHHVKMGESEMTVNELVAKHQAMCDEIEAAKKKNLDDPDQDGDPNHGKVDMESADKMNADDDKKDDKEEKKENKEDDKKDDKEEPKKNAKSDDELAAERAKKADAKAKADKLRNAQDKEPKVANIDLSEDRVARGKTRYGS